jgi:DNA polymerase-3 subunit delta'
VQIPAKLTSIGACMQAATNVSEIAKDEAEAITTELDAREKKDLDSAYGVFERGRRPREYSPALGALEKDQKTRAKRRILDVADRCLMDLTSVYRDAIALSVGAPGALVNEEMRAEIEQLTRQTTPEELLRMIDAIFTAREQMLDFNVPPLLALESMMVALRLPGGAGR